MKHTHIVLGITLACLLTSCSDFFASEVDLDKLPNIESKFVVQAFCAPDSTFFVAVGKSKVIGQKGDYAIDGATVTVTVDNSDYLLSQTFDKKLIVPKGYGSQNDSYGNEALTNFGFYHSPTNKFEAGKTYTITVSKNGKVVSGSLTIPAAPQNFTVKLDSSYYNPQLKREDTDYTYFIDIGWVVEDEKDAFLVDVFSNYEYAYNTGNSYYYYDSISMQYIYMPEYDTIKYDYNALFYNPQQNYFNPDVITRLVNPNLPKGSFFTKRLYFQRLISGTASPNLKFRIMRSSSDFYKYNESLYNNQFSGGDPFSEPIPVHSNITGGLGCVAGYYPSVVTLK